MSHEFRGNRQLWSIIFAEIWHLKILTFVKRKSAEFAKKEKYSCKKIGNLLRESIWRIRYVFAGQFPFFVSSSLEQTVSLHHSQRICTFLSPHIGLFWTAFFVVLPPSKLCTVVGFIDTFQYRYRCLVAAFVNKLQYMYILKVVGNEN